MLETQDLWTLNRQSGALWPVTIDLLRSAYLVPKPKTVFDLAAHLANDDGNAPWSASLRTAPGSTVPAIETALRRLMLATPDLDPAAVDLSRLDPASRAFRHLSALKALWISLYGALPDDLHVIRHVLQADKAEAVLAVPVFAGGRVRPPRLVQSLIMKLQEHHGPVDDRAQVRFFAERDALVRGAKPGSLLASIQKDLSAPVITRRPRDPSLAAYSVRDAVLCGEVAAARIQLALSRDRTLAPSDFALLMPQEDGLIRTVADGFLKAGLPLSGLPASLDLRPLAADLLHLFLDARSHEPPLMARAALLCHPLMPWSLAAGHRLANQLMQQNGRLPDDGLTDDEKALLGMILSRGRQGGDALSRDLMRLFRSLTANVAFATDVAEAKALAGKLAGQAKSAPDDGVRIAELKAMLPASTPLATDPDERTTGGVRVFIDGVDAWASAKHLIVLDYSEGHFPLPPGSDPFMLDSEITAIFEATGLDLCTRADLLADRLALFQRQLSAATESVTFLVPVRDAEGGLVAPSASLPLIARFVEGCEDPDHLIHPLDDPGRLWPEDMPLALETKSLPAALIMPEGDTLALGQNLFELRRKPDGSVRPQSPSRFETLMVSPLAWLLEEADAVDRPWAPETLDPRIMGNVAHKVLELLFVAGSAVPGEDEIKARFPAAFETAIGSEAPFLLADAWSVDRASLANSIRRSALEWRSVLVETGSEVIATEFWLSGELFGVRLSGKADCLLRLGDAGLVIVDHKKSGSGGRLKRLEKGWDLQVEIYRQLALQGAKRPLDDRSGPAEAALSGANRIGLAYHTLNDSAVLVQGVEARGLGGVTEIVTDPSVFAMEAVEAAVRQAIKGTIKLNRAGDPDRLYKDAGISAYAFDKSPLVRLFMLPDEDTAEEASE